MSQRNLSNEGKRKKRGPSPGDPSELGLVDTRLILLKLYAQGGEVAERIEQTVIDHLSRIDVEEIAGDVYYELDHLEVEALWDRSGNTHFGYVEPVDAAWEMAEEVIGDHLERLEELNWRGMYAEAGEVLVGILDGIDRFARESGSKFLDWLGDGVKELKWMAAETWREGCGDRQLRARIERRIQQIG